MLFREGGSKGGKSESLPANLSHAAGEKSWVCGISQATAIDMFLTRILQGSGIFLPEIRAAV
jgi:hypothetical protein